MIYITGAIMAFAFFIQILMGFGGGLIAIPLLSLFVPISYAVTLVMIFQFLTGFAVIASRKDIDWSIIKAVMPATCLGIIIGVFGLRYINDDLVRIFLAAFLIIYLLKSIFGIDFIKNSVVKIGDHGVGLLGGFIAGLIGMGAPIYVVYFAEKGIKNASFRANMLTILFISYVLRLPLSAGLGFIDKNMLINAAYILPAFLIAIFLAQKIHLKIPEALFKNIVNILLGLSTIVLLTKVFI